MNFPGVKASGNSRIHAGNVYYTTVADNSEDRITKVLQSLSSDYVEHLKAIEPRVSGTCEWFVRNEKYLAWRNSNVSSVLLVSADPGCGKSVLSRWLVEESLKEDDAAGSKTCYFFFKDSLQGRAHGSDALKAILHQLLRRLDRGLATRLLPDFESHGDKVGDKIEELWEILSKLQRHGAGAEIICFIDALDECELYSRNRLSKAILGSFHNMKNANSTQTRLKIFLTTRPYEDIMGLFLTPRQATNVIRFDGTEHTEEVARDIDLVIDEKVPYLAISLSRDLQEHLKSSLKEITHRTYLWLYLMLDVIEHALKVRKTATHMDQTLGELPQSITSAYSAILNRCLDKDKALILLKIVVAARRPLTIRELNIAYELACSHNSKILFHNDLECEDNKSFKHTIRNICGLFLTVHDSKVFLFHQTAREYLLHDGQVCCDGWQHFSEREAHLVVAQVCLNYLEFDIFRKPLRYGKVPWREWSQLMGKKRGSYRKADVVATLTEGAEVEGADQVTRIFSCFGQTWPLLKYSATHWVDHFRYCEWHHSQANMLAAIRLCSTEDRGYHTWTMLTDRDYSTPPDADDIVIAAMLDLPSVVESLIKRGITANAQVAYYIKALYQASIHGHKKVVEVILSAGADINTHGDCYLEALCEASRRGFEEIVEMLLATDVDINASTSSYDTALCAASSSGKTQIVGMLLQRGADMGVCDQLDRNALHTASMRGDVQIVEMFLANGAKVNARSIKGFDALYLASFCGQVEVVKMLLAAGADINGRRGEFLSPLEAAYCNRHKEVVALLLAAGADDNVGCDHCGNALQDDIRKIHEANITKLWQAKA